ncbi:MAG: aminopeptidase [Firmicutes bacterium]|nr:aminopeptidase [Bacillota bacterium]
MKKTVLRKYAHLIAAKGVNVQKGQEVFIQTEFDQPEFVKMLVEECYKLGAKSVKVDWTYQPLTKVHTRYMSLKTLGTLEDYEAARWQHYVNTIPCRIYLESEDPDGLKGINQKKLSKAMQKRMPLIRAYRDQIENKYQWCIAAVPGEKWAKKLFPNLSRHQAIEKLWEAILTCARVTDDPMAAWDAHNKDLKARCKYLNSLGIESLEYKSENGTDFKVWMIEGAHFNGGADTSLLGNVYNPNMPSEECFISPLAGHAEGIVYATKPLSYNGQLIENFWVRFENGKAVEWDAEKGKDVLGEIINMDEGSCMLGEVALVPYDSPINNSGLLFYNTLFDENAACHLALGFGFADCLDDFEKLESLQEAYDKGVNKSFMHVDFMIGSKDLSIVANTRDGKKVQIFKDGNWAF